MRFNFSSVLATTIFLCSCASPPRPSASYVDPSINTVDAKTLAEDAAAYLSNSLPPAKTMLLIDPPSTRSGADLLTSAMQVALREKGYGVLVISPQSGDPKEKSDLPSGTALRYLASPLENGLLLRLQFQKIEASRFYHRNTEGTLLPNGFPFTVGGGNEK